MDAAAIKRAAFWQFAAFVGFDKTHQDGTLAGIWKRSVQYLIDVEVSEIVLDSPRFVHISRSTARSFAIMSR